MTIDAASNYPETRAGDTIDMLHGHQIADPFRWLEDPDSAETVDWVRRQNAFTQSVIADYPEREAMRARIEATSAFAYAGAPMKLSGHYIAPRNSGLQNQDVWYIADTLEELRAGGRVLMDPNTMAADGTVSVSGFDITSDGKTLSYSVSTGGSDWSDFKLLDIATGSDVTDTRLQSKNRGATWLPDNASYIYSKPATDADMTGTEAGAIGVWQLRRHVVGTEEAQDAVLLQFPEEPTFYFHPLTVTHDERWLAVGIYDGTAVSNRLWLYPLTTDATGTHIGEPLKLVDTADASFQVIRVDGDNLYVLTNADADRGRVARIDLAAFATDGSFTLTEVIAEAEDNLTNVLPTKEELITVRLHNARVRLDRYSLTGKHLGTIETPTGAMSTRGGVWSSPTSSEYFLTWNTPTRKSLALRGVDGSNALESLADLAPTANGTPSDVTVDERWATSADGTQVPYFVMRRSDVQASDPHPTLLYGYGGFNIALGIEYRPVAAAWLEAGGTVAIAILRGGGEFGTAWYEGGRLANKQNVFDDFIAIGEHLCSTGVTSRAQLTIHGGSNGGLLVGAVMTQRPDLAAVALPAVGVMDLLRFHKFTFGIAWVSDYGNPDNAEDFEVALAYSPLHNVRPAEYPATMITTGDHDDRVVPLHSHKFTATLQRAQRGTAPITTRIESAGGHGAGKGRAQRNAELADMLGFAAHHTGLQILS